MPITVQRHLRRHARARREHPRGPVVTIKMRRQDAFYVVGTLIGDQADLEGRIRERAKSEDRALSEDDKLEIRETSDVVERVKKNILKSTTRSTRSF